MIDSHPLTEDSDVGRRVLSIDALRGLVVSVWLVSDVLLPVLNGFQRNSLVEAVSFQLSPSLWRGMNVYDLVLPTLLLIAGASIAPAFAMREASGQTNKQQRWRIVRRVMLLVGLGLLCEGGLFETSPAVRLVGTFQRLALCYAVAAYLHLATRWRFQAALVTFLLVGYGVALGFCSRSADSELAFTFDGNLAAVVDSLFLPGRKYFGTWDPAGIITSIPAIAVAVAGLLAGQLLTATRRGSGEVSLRMLLVGVAAVNLGCLADYMIPCIPYLWTSSFSLISIGVGLCLLSILHAAGSSRAWSSWAALVPALGRNAIVSVLTTLVVLRIFAASALFPLNPPLWLFSPLSLGGALLSLAAGSTVALWLDRRHMYVTV